MQPSEHVASLIVGECGDRTRSLPRRPPPEVGHEEAGAGEQAQDERPFAVPPVHHAVNPVRHVSDVMDVDGVCGGLRHQLVQMRDLGHDAGGVWRRGGAAERQRHTRLRVLLVDQGGRAGNGNLKHCFDGAALLALVRARSEVLAAVDEAEQRFAPLLTAHHLFPKQRGPHVNGAQLVAISEGGHGRSPRLGEPDADDESIHVLGRYPRRTLCHKGVVVKRLAGLKSVLPIRIHA
mmetsp:Transcript_21653/g.49745  ORF Transcript_21653/g.49745 Transcript_21653/m.49745 type:complete len:235 (+) Transcript_21653:562-1266(+)